MLWEMGLANLISGAILLLLGVLVLTGKFNYLLAGFNTMSAEKQKQWNMKAVSRFLGSMLMAMGTVILVSGVLILFDIAPVIELIVSWSVFTVLLIFTVVFVNVNPRFKSKDYTSSN